MIFEEMDWRPPHEVFAAYLGEPFAHLLHAGARTQDIGWSILVARPTDFFELHEGRGTLNGALIDGEPLHTFDRLLEARRRAISLPQTPFLTGAIGHIGYEAGALFEPAARGPQSPFVLPDLAFGFYDAALLFDRVRGRAYAASLDPHSLNRLLEHHNEKDESTGAIIAGPVSSNFSYKDYCRAVDAIIEAILRGDIFQANIAQHLTTALTGGTAFDLFCKVSEASDAPYGAFFQYKGGDIISNSPERFFKVTGDGDARRIVVEPIKGTRPRGATPDEDQELARSLLTDPKDRAENIMIADLMRNDLSIICDDQSIKEDAICALESYASVHHLVSRISGVLRKDVTAVDILKALFPSGSITGAPKIEAMRKIAIAEPVGRGPYCGAHGFIDDRGFSDFSVSIRTMIAENHDEGKKLTFPVGGGITARSAATAEHAETLVKARSFLRALGIDEASIK
ncbi:MAG: anthranilate synthase component I family protein [Pseudomonadota bacterium]